MITSICGLWVGRSFGHLLEQSFAECFASADLRVGRVGYIPELEGHMLRAKGIDRPPQFQFAVLSVERGQSMAVLESSFESAGQAEGMFDRQYSKWGLANTNFYLVDWQKQTVLKTHEVWQ